MNIIVQNRRDLGFPILDLDVRITHYEEFGYITVFFIYLQYYFIEVKLLAQIWEIKRRFRDFDSLNRKVVFIGIMSTNTQQLRRELGFELEDGLPILPPKRFFYNKEKEFLFNRMKSLNEYLQALISMYEAIAHPTQIGRAHV